MNHYEAPRVENINESGVAIWCLRGDWTRDLPLDVRRDAAEKLDIAVTGPLLVDLQNVSFMDSWGEEVICSALVRVRGEGHKAVWVYDPTRRTYCEGVERAFARRKMPAESHTTLASAMAALTP